MRCDIFLSIPSVFLCEHTSHSTNTLGPVLPSEAASIICQSPQAHRWSLMVTGERCRDTVSSAASRSSIFTSVGHRHRLLTPPLGASVLLPPYATVPPREWVLRQASMASCDRFPHTPATFHPLRPRLHYSGTLFFTAYFVTSFRVLESEHKKVT